MAKIFKYDKDNIDTDAIIPGKYLCVTDPNELAKVCMEGLDPEFVNKVSSGDIIVAGRNFGCGSSREHAPIALKECGIVCVIASSFARIFFRNSINIGLPVIESAVAANDIAETDSIHINFDAGIITNETKNKTYTFAPFSDSINKIIKAGNMVEYVKTK